MAKELYFDLYSAEQKIVLSVETSMLLIMILLHLLDCDAYVLNTG